MARDYRTLKLEILAETKQFVDDMKKGEKQVETFGDKATKMGKVAAAAFAAAAAAAAAYAGKLAIEGVKAAIEDEAAQNRLANALRNVTKATDAQIKSVEEQITQLSLANGIADDQLRPAFQRLATATGDLSKASGALTLALDISAATGKSVEAVSNALGKAYEGNSTALSRLGIGLSTAEIKTLGLDGTMKKLADTFQGAATVQANTLEGQIARLQVAFDEAKESVGAALLPTLQKLLDYFVNTVIPNFIKFKDAAIAPVTQAIERNKESLTLLYNFIRQYIIPIIVEGFGDALKFIGRIAGGILDVIGAVVNGIKSAVDFAINGINALIKAYNAIPLLPNVPTISAPKVSAPAPSIPKSSDIPTPVIPTPSVGSTAPSPTPSTDNKKAEKVEDKIIEEIVKDMPKKNPTEFVREYLDYKQEFTGGEQGAFIRPDSIGDITIIVDAPSMIDEEGFKRAVVDALNESANRGTGGGGSLKGNAQVL